MDYDWRHEIYHLHASLGLERCIALQAHVATLLFSINRRWLQELQSEGDRRAIEIGARAPCR